MIVTYWGVRGSMPSPGPSTVRYGGNTACVSIEAGNDVLVIDAGTGIRALGKTLVGTKKRIFIAQSHLHYDHVLGFPLFAPLFEEGRPIYLIGFPQGDRVWSPLDLMDGTHWPVRPDELRSKPSVVGEDGYRMLAENGLTIDRIDVNHPGGAYGFRATNGKQSFVHITDNELHPPGEPASDFDQITDFCRDVDVLSHDAQYLENEMPMKEGWGHSLASSACRLAVEAHVGCLVLYHHDPDRSDLALDQLALRAKESLGPHDIKSIVAYEGLQLDLRKMERIRKTSATSDHES